MDAKEVGCHGNASLAASCSLYPEICLLGRHPRDVKRGSKLFVRPFRCTLLPDKLLRLLLRIFYLFALLRTPPLPSFPPTPVWCRVGCLQNCGILLMVASHGYSVVL
ncbi:hypothetical protein CEXT_371201 [Caerostris extrusa]|uniref:Uncharacterized protein n=1 Tax=Caerostris extrusa TaxID=172846 RepID=A0AAV4T0E6_CAEEX|nr:hypothetical protein CEXT_371201 [Caerostris extrusa]